MDEGKTDEAPVAQETSKPASTAETVDAPALFETNKPEAKTAEMGAPSKPAARRTLRARVAKLYTPSQKAEILEYAAEHGVTAAAEKFGASRFSIYGWHRLVEKAAAGEAISPFSGLRERTTRLDKEKSAPCAESQPTQPRALSLSVHSDWERRSLPKPPQQPEGRCVLYPKLSPVSRPSRSPRCFWSRVSSVSTSRCPAPRSSRSSRPQAPRRARRSAPGRVASRAGRR